MKNKIKKHFFVLFFVFFLFSKNVFAQGVMFVEDITAIATAIENGLTMYNDLMTTIEQFQKTCEQVENMKKQMESFDLSKYDWKKWDTFLHAADDFMKMQDDLESLIDNKNMKIGNVNFSLRDLYTTDLWIGLMDESELKLDPRNISEEDQRRFISRHGMSYQHYAKFTALEKQIETKASETIVKAEQARASTKALNEQLNDISTETESDKQAQDTGNQLAKAGVQAQIIQTEYLIDLSETLNNLTQHIKSEHDLEYENFAASEKALEKHDRVVNGAYRVNDDKEYLHFWHKGTNVNIQK